MKVTRLHAIGIEEVREIFRAPDKVAERLRWVFDQHYRLSPDDPAVKRSLLSILGPLLKRHPGSRPIPQDRPLPADAEALLAGRAISFDRLPFAWQVLETWLDDMSYGTLTLEIDPRAFDFDLGKAGLPAESQLTLLIRRSAQLPIRPLPGMRVGYAKNTRVITAREELTNVIGDVCPESAQPAGQLLTFFNKFPGWTWDASNFNRPKPDLLIIRTGED